MPTGTQPYDLGELLGGPGVRVLRAPITEDVPEDPADIFDQVGPDYLPNGDWEDFGATTEASSYEREFESDEQEIEQATGAVLEQISNVVRQVTVPVAQVSPEHLRLFEGADEVEDISSATGLSAYKKIAFGNIESLERQRIAFVAQRPKGAGADVTETVTGKVRGGFVICVLHSVQLAADSAELEIEKGALAALPMTFKAFPVEGQSAGEEHGTWFSEVAGTISGS